MGNIGLLKPHSHLDTEKGIREAAIFDNFADSLLRLIDERIESTGGSDVRNKNSY